MEQSGLLYWIKAAETVRDMARRNISYNYFRGVPLQKEREELEEGPSQLQRTTELMEDAYPSTGKSPNAVDDSLMEFIAEYFEGNVTNDFSECEESSLSEQMVTDDSKASSGFDSSSIEIFTSPETSLLNLSDDDKSTRRRSISYEIRFMNSKEENGKVKIKVLPINMENTQAALESSVAKPIELTEVESLRFQNALLQKKVQVLEKKLVCVEKESGRVVGEMKKIIERKNKTISQLELQIAGIDFSE